MTSSNETLRFDGQAILITGAGGGLGREYAFLLASRGARIVVADNGSAPADGSGGNTGPAEAVVAEIKAIGGEAVPFTQDLSCEAGARGAVEASIAAFGRIDAIVHNASFAPFPEEVDAISTEIFARMLHVNTFAAFWMISAAWRRMRDQGGGRIVLTSSAAIFGSQVLPYGTAKASFLGMGRALAAAGLPHNILTNVILPTAATRHTTRFPPSAFMNWFNETLRAERVAPTVAFLCHNACQLNGETISIAGNRIARIRILETLGQLGQNASIEDAQKCIDAVMSEQSYFFPDNPSARSMRMAEIMGFKNTESDDDPYGYRRKEQGG